MGGYVVIIGIGAFLEKPALRGLDAKQLNGLMAIAMTAVALVAFAVEGPKMPMSLQSLGGVGVGAMVGVASVSYFLGLRSLPVSVAAAASNSYIVIAVLLSTVVLHQPMTKARGGAIILTLGGLRSSLLGRAEPLAFEGNGGHGVGSSVRRICPACWLACRATANVTTARDERPAGQPAGLDLGSDPDQRGGNRGPRRRLGGPDAAGNAERRRHAGSGRRDVFKLTIFVVDTFALATIPIRTRRVRQCGAAADELALQLRLHARGLRPAPAGEIQYARGLEL